MSDKTIASKQEAYRDRGEALGARISKDMEMSAKSVLKAQGMEYHDEESKEDAMLEILLDLELGFLEGMRSYMTTLDMSMDEAGVGMGEDDEDAMFDDEAVINNIEAEEVGPYVPEDDPNNDEDYIQR